MSQQTPSMNYNHPDGLLLCHEKYPASTDNMEKLCTVQYTQHSVTIYCTTSALIEIIVILQHGKYF